MRFLDIQHPFFIPLWRRLAFTGVCLGWSIFEFIYASPFFGILFGAAGLYCAHQFFVVFNPKDPE